MAADALIKLHKRNQRAGRGYEIKWTELRSTWGVRESGGRHSEKSRGEVNFRNWDILVEKLPFLFALRQTMRWIFFLYPASSIAVSCFLSPSLSRSPVLGDLTVSEAYVFIKTSVKSGMWKGLEREGGEARGKERVEELQKVLDRVPGGAGSQSESSVSRNSAQVKIQPSWIHFSFSFFLFFSLVITARDILEKSYCPRMTDSDV